MAPRLLLLPLFLSTASLSAQVLPMPDDGWHLWPDTAAAWRSDTLLLDGGAHLPSLPLHPPTGGWQTLERAPGILVTLPSTVEEHYWGAFGLRPYSEEYAYETDDPVPLNGSYLGVSWWWRDVDVPASFKGKRILLVIRAARLRAEVYCNEQLVGYNILSETSFTCDLSDAAHPGMKNRIAVRITNPGGRLDWIDTQLMNWGSTGQRFHKSHGFGGLDRALRLEAHEPVYIGDLWVLNTQRVRTVTAFVRLVNHTSRPVRSHLSLQVLAPDSGEATRHAAGRLTTARILLSVPAGRDTVVRTDLSCPTAQLWSTRTPALYTMEGLLSTARLNGRPMVDRSRRSFGFRWFAADSIGTHAVLRLNGERIRLLSAISWGFWGYNGLWPTRALAEREVAAARTLGLNCLQFHRNTGKAEVLDAQDRVGLLRYMEPGGGQTALGGSFSLYAPSPRGPIDETGKDGGPGSFAERYMEEKIIQMVRDHRSHPSLLIYTLQNEIHPDLRNPRIFHLLRRVHEEDPSRIVVLKSGFPSGSYPVNQAWMEPYSSTVRHDTGDAFSGWWDDHTVGGPGVWQDDLYKGPDDFTHRSVNEMEIVVWGEMLGAAAPDNHAAMVRELRSSGGSSYDVADHAAVLDAYERFLDRWGFRTAFPTADALFTAAGNRSYDFWGRVIETARLADANDYFVISGWESTAIENHSGLVDNLRGFKGNPALLRERVRPLRPVIRTRSLVYATGCLPAADLFLLNETGAPHGGQMELTLTGPDGAARRIGTFAVPPLQRDRFVYPVTHQVPLGRCDREGRYRLRAVLSGVDAAATEEVILVVDSTGTGPLPRSVGVVSLLPELARPFDPLPNVHCVPYVPGGQYDALIAANRFVRPPVTRSDTTTEVLRTDDDALYRSIFYGDPGSLEFLIPGMPRTQARVTLKFAEPFQNAPGLRVFDVALNGRTVLTDFDVFRAAGGKNIAFDTSFVVPTPDGSVHVTFPRVSRPSARISGIKVEGEATVRAVWSGDHPFTDSHGQVWGPYEPPDPLGEEVLARVRTEGIPLLVLSEGAGATESYGRRLGTAGAFTYLGVVGDARASWMGSWHVVRNHPVFNGLPTDQAMDSYYQVPVTNASGLLIEGNDIEVCTGYSRDHERNVAAASILARIGKGRLLVQTMPGVVGGLRGTTRDMHPVVFKRLLANSLRVLQAQAESRPSGKAKRP